VTPQLDLFVTPNAQTQTNKNLRPGRVVSGHKTAAVVLRLKIPPPERWWFCVNETMTKLSQTPMFRQSLPIQLGKNLPQQKKNTDLKPLQTPGLSFTSQIHRPTGSHVRYIYLHVPQYQPSMQIDQPSLEQATFSKVTNHSNALIIYPDLCAISRQFQVMRSLSWFIIYRRCARCPGSIKIFRVGYLRYFHGNLRAPTSSLGGIIKIDQKIHENPKNMA